VQLSRKKLVKSPKLPPAAKEPKRDNIRKTFDMVGVIRQYSAMNWLDITILVILVAGLIQGLIKGFVRQAFSLIGLILAIILAFRYHDLLASYLGNWIHNQVALTVISFVIVLAVVVLLFKLIALAARAAIAAVQVGWVDRIIGGVFGFLRSVLLIAVLFALFVICTDKPTKPMVESKLTPRAMEVSRIIARFLPASLYERYARNEENIDKQLGRTIPSSIEEKANEPSSI